MKRLLIFCMAILCACAAFASPASDFYAAVLQNDAKAVQRMLKDSLSPNIKLTAEEYAAFAPAFDEKSGFFRNMPHEARSGALSHWEPRPLHIAVQMGFTKLAKLLLKAGADIDALDGLGGTALTAAYALHNAQAVAVLLKQGADVTIGTIGSQSLAAYAVASGDVETLKALKKAGADMRQTDSEGNTLLLLAVKANRVGVVKQLFKGNKDLAHENNAGENALTAADNDASRYISGVLHRRQVLHRIGLALAIVLGAVAALAAIAVCAKAAVRSVKNALERRRQRAEHQRLFVDTSNYEETKDTLTDLIQNQQAALDSVISAVAAQHAAVAKYEQDIAACGAHSKEMQDALRALHGLHPFKTAALKKQLAAEEEKRCALEEQEAAAVTKLHELQKQQGAIERAVEEHKQALQKKQRVFDRHQIEKQAAEDRELLEKQQALQAQADVKAALSSLEKNIGMAVARLKSGGEVTAAHLSSLVQRNLARIEDRAGALDAQAKRRLSALREPLAALQAALPADGTDARAVVAQCAQQLSALAT